ncbi:hypothetical protein BKA81DRAFT_367534 [Phyllosticta paracitricarpa]|uniref:S1 motif domain-containing protein n=1 Tax=Phyllosticta paracitricarpa TaxID=2016321 RepID=A0ABR1MVG5_9PEZI
MRNHAVDSAALESLLLQPSKMAPVKRGADSDHAGSKKQKHAADDRAAKRQRKSDPAPAHAKTKPEPKTDKPVPVASVLTQEERSFPRGGASVLTPLEHKQIQNEAARDVLFEQSNKKATKGDDSDDDVEMGDAGADKPAKKKKSKKRKSDAAEKEKDEGIKIESLTHRRLQPGSMVLGQVTQITPKDIQVALPNNLVGFVPLTAVSDQFTKRIEALLGENDKSDAENSADEDDLDLNDVIRLGQYVRAVVTSTGDDSARKNKKRIELSINPKDVNSSMSKQDLVVNAFVQASVASVEDHGLVMDLGLASGSTKGFMSSKEVGYSVDYNKIQPGAVFLCIVTGSSSNGKIVKLSADVQKIGNVKKTNVLTEAPTIDAFQPGAAVDLLVTESTSSGLAGQIIGLLDATADVVHAGAAETQKDISQKYKVGSKVKARIICTFPSDDRRKLGVSLLSHVMALSPRQPVDEKKGPIEFLPISSIVEEAKVTHVEPLLGVFLDVGIKGVPGFAHISRLSDDKVDSISADSGKFKINSTHRARVIAYNPLDGLFLISLENKILEQPFLRVDDVKVGQVVKGKVEKVMITALGSGAVIVNLAEGINGVVSETQIADVQLKNPEKKFREGMPVTARVLAIDPVRKMIRLTLKKTLVNSEAPVWSSYSDVEEGDSAPGTIVKLMPAGALVQFYGNLKAFLPVGEMSEAYIKDPSEHFRVGQTINVHAISINAENNRMTVSCKDPSVHSPEQQAAFQALQVGSVVKATVSEKSVERIDVELEGSSIKGILKVGQLTDGSEKKEESMMKRIRVGQTLEDLVILDKSEKRPLVWLTNKPSLLAAAKAGSLPSKFEDIREGQTVNGFVQNVDGQRVFVEFAGRLRGVLLKTQMSQEMAEKADYGLRPYQSITARVLVTDPAKQRFLLTKKDEKDAAASMSAPKTDKAANKTLVNPADETVKDVSEYTLGKLTKARVTSVKETQLNVSLADNVLGRIDISEVFSKWEDIKDRKHPLAQFKTKPTLPVRIIGVHDVKNHKFLPISHRSAKTSVFEMTAKTETELSTEDDLLSLEKLKVGSTHIAFVNNIGENCVWAHISPVVRGRIDLMDLSSDVSLLSDVAANFPIGSALKVRIKSVDVSANRLDLTATSDSVVKPTSLKDLSPGSILPGRVTKVTERNIMVQLSDSISGPVTLTEFSDDYAQANPTIYKKNQIVRVCVLDVDAPNKKLVLSMRPSKVLSSSLPVKDPQVANIRQLKVNDVVRGFVKNVADKGLFVSLSPNVTAFVRISDLSDSYIKDWKSAFEVDQLLKGKVISVDPALNHVQLTLKASMLDKNYVAPLTFGDLKPRMVVTGKVRKVEDFGVFVVFDNSSNVSGLCHRSQIADQPVDDCKKLYSEGDKVKAIVLSVDRQKHKVSLGLKASYFKSDDEEESDDEDGGVEIDEDDSDSDEDAMDGVEIDMSKVKDMESSEDDDEDEDEMEVDEKPSKSVNGLSTSGFDWTGATLEQDKGAVDERDSGDDAAAPKKKKKKPTIVEDRTGDLDANGPQSVADFERLLLGDPNNSALWMQYMAFQIGLNEVQKARDIAERALKTIHMREEEEKLNMWTALLNLEIEQGDEERVEDVFGRACQHCDKEEIHNRLLSIYTSTGRYQKAEELFQKMSKNKSLTPNPAFWLNYATFLLTTLNEPARARALLPRALQSIPPKPQHARHLTAKFAALEFQSPHGDAERGRTVFEGLLSTYPKRWDLWDMFVDLEKSLIKQAKGQGAKENVSKLYERMAGMKMKAKRARFVFRKWAEWEEKEGGKKSQERVRALAEEYAEKLRKAKEGGDEDEGSEAEE